jgi:hypothetical protein
LKTASRVTSRTFTSSTRNCTSVIGRTRSDNDRRTI